MPTCVLVLGDGTVTERTRDCEPHVLGGTKGRWARLIDVAPSYDATYQTRARTVPANVPSGDVTVQYTVADKSLAAFKADRKTSVKLLARSKILARYPDWKQINMVARAVELLKLGQAGNAEGLALQAAWDWVKATRDRSDTIEAAIDAAANAQAVAAVDINTGWPI